MPETLPEKEMPNEISEERLRELEKRVSNLKQNCYDLDSSRNQALSELAALKAKVERLKHHVEHYCGECQEEILSILDGKEG